VKKIGILVGLSALGLAVLRIALGPGETIEFSAESLCYREKDVWSVPILDLPVFERVKSTRPHPLKELWIEKGYVRQESAAASWEVVRWWTRGNPMEWTVIGNLFDEKTVGLTSHWCAWTAAHPKEADEFWPEVIGHIRSRRYRETVLAMQRYAWDGSP
jgi:hypothetical protein